MTDTKKIRRGGVETASGYLFELSAAHPALDLTNTLDWRAEAEPRELLSSYERLADWTEQSRILRPSEVAALRREARRRPARAARALRRAIEAREAMFAVFHAAASGKPIPRRALTRFEALVREAMSHRTLVAGTDGVEWRWTFDERVLDRMLWPVVLAAADLLTSPRLARVRVCDGDPCEWLFLDQSQKGNRRWCDMTVCGNRAKARRFYARARGAE